MERTPPRSRTILKVTLCLDGTDQGYNSNRARRGQTGISIRLDAMQLEKREGLEISKSPTVDNDSTTREKEKKKKKKLDGGPPSAHTHTRKKRNKRETGK